MAGIELLVFLNSMTDSLLSPPLLLSYIVFFCLTYKNYRKERKFVFSKGMKILLGIIIFLIILAGISGIVMYNAMQNIQ